MFAERLRPPRPDLDFSELSFGLLGLVQQSKERLSVIAATLDGRRVVESAHKNWDNTNYCRSLSIDAPNQYSREELLHLFPANSQAFFDEYVLGSVVKEYPLSVSERGTTGLNDQYKELLGDQAKRFEEEKVKPKDKRKQRATIETQNSVLLDHWLAKTCFSEDIPVGTKLVWFSPPGFRIEGYHGVSRKHHSFIWVYEKRLKRVERTHMVSDPDHLSSDVSPYVTTSVEYVPEMVMTQFRCWPSLSQVEAIQDSLRKKSRPTGILPSSDTTRLTRRNAVIAEFIELPPDISLSIIEEIIYDREDSWVVQRSDMPDLSEQQIAVFTQYREHIVENFLVPMYANILASTPEVSLPYSNPFWQSKKYADLVHRLDLAFALTWQHLMHFVETGIPDNITANTLSSTKTLCSLYELKLKHEQGHASSEDKKLFNAIAPGVLSAGSRLLSVGQCGIGTLIPVQLLDGLEGLSFLKGIKSLAKLTSYDIRQLSVSERVQFRSQVLGQFKPLTLKNSFGRIQKYWVRSEYYDDYLYHSYEKEPGRFFGRCDVSLDTGEDVFVLTDVKYQELLEASTAPAMSAEQLLHNFQTELQDAKTPQKRSALLGEYEQQRKLFRLDAVSVTELINDDLYISASARV